MFDRKSYILVTLMAMAFASCARGMTLPLPDDRKLMDEIDEHKVAKVKEILAQQKVQVWSEHLYWSSGPNTTLQAACVQAKLNPRDNNAQEIKAAVVAYAFSVEQLTTIDQKISDDITSLIDELLDDGNRYNIDPWFIIEKLLVYCASTEGKRAQIEALIRFQLPESTHADNLNDCLTLISDLKKNYSADKAEGATHLQLDQWIKWCGEHCAPAESAETTPSEKSLHVSKATLFALFMASVGLAAVYRWFTAGGSPAQQADVLINTTGADLQVEAGYGVFVLKEKSALTEQQGYLKIRSLSLESTFSYELQIDLDQYAQDRNDCYINITIRPTTWFERWIMRKGPFIDSVQWAKKAAACTKK